jgi:hypothetical protein
VLKKILNIGLTSVQKPRHVILHYHVFKNAGSTVSSILINNFGASQCGDIEGKNSWDTLSDSDILRYAINNPGLKAISSHHARLPVPNHSDFVFHPLIFLRHPIDRIGSVYSYERKRPASDKSLGVRIAHEYDFAGYVKYRLTDGSAPIRNFQTVHLSGHYTDMRKAIATEEDLKMAMETLSQLKFFGIVELFDKSMVKMKRYLSGHFHNFNINYVAANIDADRKNTIEDRLDEIKSSLGQNLYQELLDKNALDLQLFNQAKTLFLLEN